MRFFHSIKNYLQETRTEIKKVSWPTKQETIRYVIIIIIFSGIVAAFLGLFDFGFLQLVEQIIIR
ncbi:MAG: preprotein translocase subunit SecE [Patescibacteria group bacterium]